jgi:GNAT superfamily N-acetyltransferase
MQTTLERRSDYGEKLIVRPALYSDRDSIARIAVASAMDMVPRDVYAKHAEENRRRLEHSGERNIDWRIARTRLLIRGAQRVMVATMGNSATSVGDGDRVVGYMFATTAVTGSYSDPLDHILIHGAAVNKSKRHKGIGRALLGTICDWSKEIGLPIRAYVADTNAPMLTLLENNDFIPQDTSGPTEQNPVTYHVMVRTAPETVLV